MTAEPVLALDLGGTQIRAAVVAPGGLVGRVERRPTPVADGVDAIVAACVAAVRTAGDAHRAAGGVAPWVVGISSPGPVDPDGGVVVDPPNLGPAFRDVPLAAALSEATGLPAVLDRDTQVAALAEGTFGIARGCHDFVYLTVSTGIGGAIVSDGRLLRGPDGAGGELGHLVVDRSGPECACGARGHLEAIASGSGISRAARRACAAGARGPLADLIALHGPTFGGRHVAEAEQAGDPLAAAIMADARDAFAQSCVAIVNVFNPELVVVGGGLAAGQGDAWLEPARAAVRALAFRRQGARARIVAAALGDAVGLIGALVLADERLRGVRLGSSGATTGNGLEPHRG